MNFVVDVIGCTALYGITAFLIGITAKATGNVCYRWMASVLTFPLSLLFAKNNPPVWFVRLCWVGMSLIWGIGLAFLSENIIRSLSIISE